VAQLDSVTSPLRAPQGWKGFAGIEAGGHNAGTFVRALSEQNQDRLEAEGGACIMYTHFAYQFFQNGTRSGVAESRTTRHSRAPVADSQNPFRERLI
jgi:hypothetical protein